MEITQEMISIESKRFEGGCPFYAGGGECSSMSFEECNRCSLKLGVSDENLKLVDLSDDESVELTIEQTMNSIAQDTENTFWLATNRYRYKVRKHTKLSDYEYDKMLEEAKDKVILIRISAMVLFDVVKELDLNNKRVQKGKEKSIMDKYRERMEEANAKYKEEEKEK